MGFAATDPNRTDTHDHQRNATIYRPIIVVLAKMTHCIEESSARLLQMSSRISSTLDEVQLFLRSARIRLTTSSTQNRGKSRERKPICPP